MRKKNEVIGEMMKEIYYCLEIYCKKNKEVIKETSLINIKYIIHAF